MQMSILSLQYLFAVDDINARLCNTVESLTIHIVYTVCFCSFHYVYVGCFSLFLYCNNKFLNGYILLAWGE